MGHGFDNVVDYLLSHASDALQAVLGYEGDERRDCHRHRDVAGRHGSGLERGILRTIRSGHGHGDSARTDGSDGGGGRGAGPGCRRRAAVGSPGYCPVSTGRAPTPTTTPERSLAPETSTSSNPAVRSAAVRPSAVVVSTVRRSAVTVVSPVRRSVTR